MKSLNKTLSLVLVLVMVLGLFGVAGAAFNDDAEIKNTEAVDTMVALGVINGKNGNIFDPTGNVTRAEMAKMICVALNGGKEPALGNAAASFTDTGSHWASKYIEYCVSLGIVAGRGDGTFDPDGSVTGSEAAKMFLCALGYRADIEKLTGASWELNTNVIANKIKLYADLEASFSPSATLNRDDAAQLIYNGVQANMVEYRNLQGDYSGVLYPVEGNSMLTNRFGVLKVTGVAAANERLAINDTATTTYAAAKEGESRVEVSSISGNAVPLGGWGTWTFKTAIADELIGQEVVLYVQFKNNLSPNAAGSVVLGKAIATDRNTVVTTTARLKDTDAVKDELKAAGIKVNAGGTNMVSYTEGTPVITATGTGVAMMLGEEQTFIDNNDDGIVDYIISIAGSVDKVKNINKAAETVTFAGLGAQDKSDLVVADGLAKDDYVSVTQYNNGKYYLDILTPAQGEVQAFAPNASGVTALNKVTVGGAVYTASAWANNSGDLTGGIPNAGNIGATMALYLDPHGNVVGHKTVASVVENYGVVITSEVQGTISPVAKVKLIDATGTEGVYTVNLPATYDALGLSGASTATAKATHLLAAANNYFAGTKANVENQLFAYSKTEDGVITLADPNVLDADYTKNSSLAALSTTATGLSKNTASYHGALADSNTIFFIENAGDYLANPTGISVVKGLASLPTAAKLTVAGATKAGQNVVYKSAVIQAMYVKLANGQGTFSASSNYAYVYGGATQTKVDGISIYTYPVVFANGEVGTLSTATPGAATPKNVYEFTTDAKGLATFTSPLNLINNAMIKVLANGSALFVNKDTDAPIGTAGVAAGAAFWNVSDIAKSGVFLDMPVKDQQVAVVLDADGNIKVVFIIADMIGDMTANVSAAVALNGDLSFTLAAGQTATVKVDGTTIGAEHTGAGTKTVGKATLGITGTQTITITVTEDNKDTRVVTLKPVVLTLDVTGAAGAAVNTANDLTGTAVATGSYVMPGTTLYVSSGSTADGREGLTATGVTLTVVTPGANATTSAIYSFVVPSANVTAAFTDADI